MEDVGPERAQFLLQASKLAAKAISVTVPWTFIRRALPRWNTPSAGEPAFSGCGATILTAWPWPRSQPARSRMWFCTPPGRSMS